MEIQYITERNPSLFNKNALLYYTIIIIIYITQKRLNKKTDSNDYCRPTSSFCISMMFVRNGKIDRNVRRVQKMNSGADV